MKKALLHVREILSLEGVRQKNGVYINEEDLSCIDDGAVVWEGKKILWVGKTKDLRREFALKSLQVQKNLDACLLPSWIDCHTHSIFAGSRSEEFELRNQGVSYEEISRRGGGIQSTVRATRGASLTELVREGQKRIEAFVRQGVGTLEVKSGYGLDLENEIKMLRAIRRLKGLRIVPTFLGAHAIAPEFRGEARRYLKMLTKALPEIRKLCGRVDIFIERGFFEVPEAREYLMQAKALGFRLCIHADQLTLSGGTDLAIELGASSADHVIQIDPGLVSRLAKSSVVAVLLPVADLYLKCPYPPARALLDAGARVALATDFNPGTAPSQDLGLVGLLARLQMQMSLPEVLSALTFNAAAALNLESEIGCLAPGYRPEFSLFSGSWRGLFESPGMFRLH